MGLARHTLYTYTRRYQALRQLHRLILDAHYNHVLHDLFIFLENILYIKIIPYQLITKEHYDDPQGKRGKILEYITIVIAKLKF